MKKVVLYARSATDQTHVDRQFQVLRESLHPEVEVVACYSLSTGHELWTYGYKALFEETWGGRGPRATPTLNGKNVLALGATGVLNCLHAETGKRLWHRNILVDAKAENLEWGMAGSPLVHDGLVYVIPGGANASVCAYDLETGQPVWQAGDNPAGYASPFVAKLAGVFEWLGEGDLVLADGGAE